MGIPFTTGTIASNTPETRAAIRAHYAYLSEIVTRNREERKRIEHVAIGFGCYDDREYEQKTRENEVRATKLYESEMSAKAFWTHIVELYGTNTINLALMEGEHRIGELPYADINEPG